MSAWLVTTTGLAIAATDTQLAAEIDRVNTAAGAAVLYLLDETPRPSSAEPRRASSANKRANAITREVLTIAAERPGETIRIDRGNGVVVAARSKVIGWWLVLMMATADA